jgi:hypothetical protein
VDDPEYKKHRPREALERLIRRRGFWREDPPLPVIMITGSEDSAIQTARWLAKPFEDHLPFADIPAGSVKDLPDLIDRLAGENGQLGAPVSGSFLPAPRFPLAQFVLWALAQRDDRPEYWDEAQRGQWPPNPNSRAGQKELRNRLKDWRWDQAKGTHRALVTSVDFFARAAPTWVPAGIVTALGADWIAGAAVAVTGTVGQAWLSIRGSIFNRWFRKQRYLTRKPFEKLWNYGLRVAQAPKDEVEQLLVHAMFEDLRQAYRKWPIPWPSWGRGLYCLLVLESGKPGSVNDRFLDVMRTVIDETGKFVPLVILAGVPQADPIEMRSVPEGTVQSFGEVAAKWRQLGDLRVPALGMVLRTSGDLPSVPHKPRLIPSRARAWFYWAVVLSLVAAPLTYAGVAAQGCGRELREEHGQCVGLSADLARMNPDQLVRGVLEAINDENDRIPPGVPIATVFYMGPLTKDPELKSGDQLNGVMGELAGLLTHQRSYNNDIKDWDVRVEFANVGQDFRSARYAAEMIEERAKSDRSVAAVIGLAWSKTETQEAIGVLGGAQLPMLSTTNTADRTPMVNGGTSPYFFRMAAPNSAQAKAMAWWLEQGLSNGGAGIRPEEVAILEQVDPRGRDLYSRDLTYELGKALPGLPESLPFDQKDPLDDRKDLTAEQKAASNKQENLLKQVFVACKTRKAKVLVYTGRTMFLDELDRTVDAECSDSPVQILAGDEVTVTIADRSKWPEQRLNFVSLTNLHQLDPSSSSSYLSAIENVVGKLWGKTTVSASRVHARLAHDALLAVTYALGELSKQQGPDIVKSSLNVAAGVHYNLRGLRAGDSSTEDSEDISIVGASGRISFDAGVTDHTATPRMLWLFSAQKQEGVLPRGTCKVRFGDVWCPPDAERPVK